MPKHTPFGLIVEPPLLYVFCNVQQGKTGVSVILKSFPLDNILVYDIFYIILVVRPRSPERRLVRTQDIGYEVRVLSWQVLEYFKYFVPYGFLRLVNLLRGIVLSFCFQRKGLVFLLTDYRERNVAADFVYLTELPAFVFPVNKRVNAENAPYVLLTHEQLGVGIIV